MSETPYTETLPKCSYCNWTNTGLLNISDPAAPQAKWICHGCVKREVDRLKQADELYRHILDQLKKREAAYAQMKDAAEFCWTLVANAGAGNWERESKDWQEAAAKARDMYHAALKDQGKTYVAGGELIDALIAKLQEMRKAYRP